MKALQSKLISANFGRLFKRWIIAALCVGLLGGGISAALLAPQISETVSAVQTLRQQREQWEQDDPHNREDWHGEHFEAEDYLHSTISRPSTAALVCLGVTALLTLLLGAAFWLGVAAWLYQTATLSGISGALWGLLGLCGNVFAAAAFLIARSFIREKCPACGRWQEKGGAFCRHCGQRLNAVCASCGVVAKAGSQYCPSCGGELK